MDLNARQGNGLQAILRSLLVVPATLASAKGTRGNKQLTV